MRELVTGMQLPDEFSTRLYATHCFDSKLNYDDAMILFEEEEKLNKLQDACSFLHEETARIAERRSARKEFTEFDIQKSSDGSIGAPNSIKRMLLPRWMSLFAQLLRFVDEQLEEMCQNGKELVDSNHRDAERMITEYWSMLLSNAIERRCSKRSVWPRARIRSLHPMPLSKRSENNWPLSSSLLVMVGI